MASADSSRFDLRVTAQVDRPIGTDMSARPPLVRDESFIPCNRRIYV